MAQLHELIQPTKNVRKGFHMYASDKNFEVLNYKGIFFCGPRTRTNIG